MSDTRRRIWKEEDVETVTMPGGDIRIYARRLRGSPRLDYGFQCIEGFQTGFATQESARVAGIDFVTSHRTPPEEQERHYTMNAPFPLDDPQVLDRLQALFEQHNHAASDYKSVLLPQIDAIRRMVEHGDLNAASSLVDSIQLLLRNALVHREIAKAMSDIAAKDRPVRMAWEVARDAAKVLSSTDPANEDD